MDIQPNNQNISDLIKIKIKICFFSNDEKFKNMKKLYEKKYSIKSSISNSLNDFILYKNDPSQKFSFFIEGKDSKLNPIEPFKSIYSYLTSLKEELNFPNNTSPPNSNLYSGKTLNIYVINDNRFEVPENIEEYIIKNTELIGKPALHELKYYVCDIANNSMSSVELIPEQAQQLGIDSFSRKSVYCNAKNLLYIYHSSAEKTIFFSISLKTLIIYPISKNFPQKNLHSMIFIPKNYIFIVGGKNTREVLTYTIMEGNQDYERYPFELPFEMLEPSLITVNTKYLYILDNNEKRLNILRTDFVLVSKFEEIKINNNNDHIGQRFFGVININNKILFLGGQMISSNREQNKCYEFDCDSNELNLSNRIYKDIDFVEKAFVPIGNKHYIQITEIFENNIYFPKILTFDANRPNPGDSNQPFQLIKSDQPVVIKISSKISNIVPSASINEIVIPLSNNN